MVEPIPYSGTGDFPEPPSSQTGGREAFVFTPPYPEALCPELDIDVDVVPDPRPVPNFPAPRLRPLTRVPTCDPPPEPQNCVPFQPLGVAAFTVNGRRYFGNNVTDKAWCTVATLLGFDINTADQWRVEWCDPAEDVQAAIEAHQPLHVAVYGGRVITHFGGGVSVTRHWPSGDAGEDAELRPADEPVSALDSRPEDNTLSGFFNHIPANSGAVAASEHPAFTPGGFSAYGKVLPAETVSDTGSRACIEYTGALPAVVYHTFPYAEEPVSAIGTVAIAAVADYDFDNSSRTVLALIGNDGRILQQHTGPIEQRADPKPYEVFFFANRYLIYLPTFTDSGGQRQNGIWRRNGSVPLRNITGATASAIHPPGGELGAWYQLPISKVDGVVVPRSVWATLEVPVLPDPTKMREGHLYKISDCTLNCVTGDADATDQNSGQWFDNAVKVAEIRSSGAVEQLWTGVIDQSGPALADADLDGARGLEHNPSLRRFKSLTLRPKTIGADSDGGVPSQAPSLYGFREASTEEGGFEPYPEEADVDKFMVPVRKEGEAQEGDSGTVSLEWMRLRDFKGEGYPRPFHLTIAGDTAGLTDCILRRDTLMIFSDTPLNVNIGSGTGTWFIYVKLNTVNNSLSAAFSDTTSGENRYCDPAEAGVPESDEVRLPLYRLHRATSDDAWQVTLDLRETALSLFN